MTQPQVAFCTTCKNRTPHLETTLPLNLQNNPQAKVILINYNTHDHLVDYLAAKHMPDIDSGRLVVFTYADVGPFKMAHAKNLSHRLAMREGCNLLVNMDADNYTAPGFDQHVLENLTDGVFLWPNLERLKVKAEGAFKGLNGRIGVTQKAFLKAGGYDEKYKTWSADDKDFDARLRRLGYQRSDIPDEHLKVVLHRDKMRFKEYPHLLHHQDETNMGIVEDPNHMVANAGRFGLGQVHRNFDPEPINLAPLPTRIFGIGWHKTATTSLHHALKILGFDSAHWKTAPWAKRIWTEMTTTGSSPTLEKSYAICDMPIPLLYKELDIAYPGSKFILTVRSEKAWLESVRKHWNPDTNPFRQQWDDDAFSHRLHEIMYGTRDFDPDIFINRYRRHNHEVCRYFKDREGDLLVLDMERRSATQWKHLCGFLGCAVPAEKYPREFKSL